MLGTHARSVRRAFFAAGILAAAVALAAPIGCGRNQNAAAPAPGEPTKVKVAYLGLTCEAPIFVAHEKGLFKEENLDVELVKTDWDGLREGLASGQFDANHTLIMYLLKAIEKNSDIKITGGIHTGCLRLQVGVKSEIKSPAELKGKKIGVPTHIGSPPYMFASRVLAANGIDPSQEAKQVTWLAFPPDALAKAIEDGRIDAVATSDPIGTILVGKGIVRTIADQATDAPYSEEYCCATVVSGQLVKKNPGAAAAVTRAMLKASKWVEANPKASAEMAVEKKYIAASAEINAQALSHLRYIPGVAKCQRSIESAAAEMKKAKLLNEATDPVALSKRAWVDLEGVTDERVLAMKVERIEGGGRPALLAPREFAALFDMRKLCCGCCCLGE
ncbi:ABC transporter substrate-binding protein [Fimbriiglobus ruber]|uniref:ABC-type nitrate/sulfonate/bicarbonate transport system, periplasmic component n=1 Tax=Fimbriiglobus ruber TaxID=1908690 RepID=A0A225DM62_9BACT|nr:ABC transporter substrate-binding protein [Fimbriiglobus ruber]OWK38299.1 ABC-type nitrate/sulfonate/bicarbonate transport system, periplasmic component [Fimbriiglobus ruber]